MMVGKSASPEINSLFWDFKERNMPGVCPGVLIILKVYSPMDISSSPSNKMSGVAKYTGYLKDIVEG